MVEVKIVVVTDVHSWIAGHGSHEGNTADYGDVLSFVRQLQAQNKNVFFLNNGDLVDGTGLGLSPPTHLLPLLEKMPWDAINCGNHELFSNDTVDLMRNSGFIQHWNGNYLSSNTVLANGEPLGNRYTYLSTKGTPDVRLLTFGFLFNFRNHCKSTIVSTVQDTVREEWFQEALRKDDYNAILVLAHMDCEDPLLTDVLLPSIRRIVGPDKPILFLAGHTHRRCFVQLDDNAASLEAGRFLDTVGIASFQISSHHHKHQENITTHFRHTFLNATRESLQQALGDNVPLDTTEGLLLSREIQATRASLGLDDIIGCSPRHYYRDRHVEDEASLWRLYLDRVVPSTITYNSSRVFVQSTGAMRYDLFEGEISRDDLIAVSPFNDTIFQVCAGLKGSEMDAILNLLNDEGFSVVPSLPPFLSTADLFADRHAMLTDAEQRFDLFGISFDVTKVVNVAKRINPENPCHPVELCTPLMANTRPFCINSIELWLDYVAQDTSCASCTIDHCIRHSTSSGQQITTLRMRHLMPTDLMASFLYYLPILLIVFTALFRTLRCRRDEPQKLVLLSRSGDASLAAASRSIAVTTTYDSI